ncbi:hypothetical protein BC936DRAFT_145585 [Jimgerdemannia flammicorona]|uniref:Uncharacterized protein n=1 Tax=Jimgerdemannia flammicorona TaxID=994334 RepID=A0A433D9R6_9FUNG|nr:hypothetical protein BC936DRAFT_145585 [Jimgerdemannia flammicorona]
MARRHIRSVILRNFIEEHDLIRHVLECLEHDPVPLGEGVDMVRESMFSAELLHIRLALSQIMPGNTRKQMVNNLELQAAVDEIHPLRAVDVHSSTELANDKWLVRPHVLHRHAKVRESDLDVERGGEAVGDQDKGEASLPVGEEGNEEWIPGEEECHAGELNVAVLGLRMEVEKLETEVVEVEAGEEHDDVVGDVLDADEALGGGVEVHDALEVARVDIVEEAGGEREEGQVLDVRVILHVVGHDVVHPTHEVPKEGADQGIHLADVRDAVVPGIVRRKHDLMPEHGKEDRTCHVLPQLRAPYREVDGEREERHVATGFAGVVPVVTLEEAGCLHLGFELLERPSDLLVVVLGELILRLQIFGGGVGFGLLLRDGGEALVGCEFTLVEAVDPLGVNLGWMHEVDLVRCVPSVHLPDGEHASRVVVDPLG